MTRLKGKILWWDQKDDCGIIRDDDMNEYYFDSSVLCEFFGKPEPKEEVEFDRNKDIKHPWCACNVGIPGQGFYALKEGKYGPEDGICLDCKEHTGILVSLDGHTTSYCCGAGVWCP